MAAHVHECAICGKLTEGATLYSKNAPRDPWGRVQRDYMDNGNAPTFCSEGHRNQYDTSI